MAAIEPHAPWSHRLKNGAPAGNPTLAPRCGARTRAGTACRRAPQPANGYCPSHQHLAETEEVELGLEIAA